MITSEAIKLVIDYIIMSEMEGHIDPKDSWYSTFKSLRELLEKVEDEEADGHFG